MRGLVLEVLKWRGLETLEEYMIPTYSMPGPLPGFLIITSLSKSLIRKVGFPWGLGRP